MRIRQSIIEPILKDIRLKIHVLELFRFEAFQEKNFSEVLIKNTINSLTNLLNTINYYAIDPRFNELYTPENIEYLSCKIYKKFLDQLSFFENNLPDYIIDKLNEAESIDIDSLQKKDLSLTQMNHNIIVDKPIDPDEEERIIRQIKSEENRLNITGNKSVLTILNLFDLKNSIEGYLGQIYTFPGVEWFFKKGRNFNENPLVDSMIISSDFDTEDAAKACLDKMKKLEHQDNIEEDEDGSSYYGIRKIKGTGKYKIIIYLGLNIQKTYETAKKSEATINELQYKIKKERSRIFNNISDEKSRIHMQEILNNFSHTLFEKINIENYHDFCNKQFLPLLSLLSTCAEKNLLNSNNLTHLTKRLVSSSNSIDQLLYPIINPILKLKNTDLLVQSNLDAIIYDNQFNKSCDARVNAGRGLRDISSSAQQTMWGYYCEGVESTIAHFIKEGLSLRFIFDYAREKRTQIAQEEEMNKYADFGRLRLNMIEDKYSNDSESIVDPNIFDSLWLLQENMLNEYKNRFNEDKNLNTLTGTFDHISDVCTLPKETVVIRNEEQHTSITTFFSGLSEDEIYDALDKLDQAFLKKMSNPHDNLQEFLLELGKLTYHLARLYPVIRGTGAIVQWIVRGIVRNNTGIELGNINLGSKRNIPYDVYAQLTQDPNAYAQVFMQALLPIFQSKLNIEEKHSFIPLSLLAPITHHKEEKNTKLDNPAKSPKNF